MRIAGMVALMIGLTLGPAEAQTQAGAAGSAIEEGSKVQLEYTLSDETGKVLVSNKGRDALTFTQGEHQIIPGLENALAGMRAGEEKTVTVKPADAYGEMNPAAVTEVPKEQIPADAAKAGTELVAHAPSGERRTVRVKEVKEQTVIIDLNHPLAGKTLVFAVKILGVEPPAK